MVPKYIRAKIEKIYKLNARSKELTCELEEWLERHRIDVDELRLSDGMVLDELDYAEGPVEDIITRIEKEVSDESKKI